MLVPISVGFFNYMNEGLLQDRMTRAFLARGSEDDGKITQGIVIRVLSRLNATNPAQC